MREELKANGTGQGAKQKEKSKKQIAKSVELLSKFIAGCSLFAFCFLPFASCRLSPPQAPRWDTSITLPIISQNYSMQKLIAEQNNLYADRDGLVHFLSESELDSFSVGDRLAIGAVDTSFVTTFGRYTMPSPGSSSAQIALRQLYPASVNLAGQTARIPAFSFSLPLLALPQYDNYLEVQSANGTLTVALRNGMATPIGPLQYEILNGVNGTTIAVVEFETEIPPGGEMTRAAGFAGKTFGNSLAFRLSGRSPGSRSNSVRIDPDSKLTTTLTLSALQVARATGKIGSLTIRDAGEADMGDSLHIVTANLKSATISIAAQGNFLVNTWLVVVLPDFYTSSNAPFQDSLLLAANGRMSKDFNLAGHSFRPMAAAFGQQKIRFRWRIRTGNTPNEMVTIDSNDFIRAAFKSSKIVFSRLTGGFNAKTIDLTPKKFKLDLPAGLDSLRLAEVSLHVILRNGINFPVHTDFQVEGVSNQGRPVQLNVRSDIKPGQPNGAPVESQITLHRGNSNIVQFLNALPKSITVSGNVTFGALAYIGMIRHTDEVSGALRFDAPLALAIPAQRVESEVDALMIDKSVRDRLKENLHRGKITARLANHLPLGASISLNLAQKNSEVFTAPDLIIGPFTLAKPNLDANTGRVIRAITNDVEITLTEAQLALFQKSPLYTGVLIELPGTQGKIVRVFADDYVGLQALAEMALTVDEGNSK